MRDNSGQWGYQPQGDQPPQNHDFVIRHRLKKRISSERKSLNRRVDQSVAVATIEALIAIINMLESD